MPSAAEIEAWLVAYIADALVIDASTIDPTASFQDYGLDSSAAVVLTGDLEEWLGTDVDPTAVVDHPTIRALAAQLAG